MKTSVRIISLILVALLVLGLFGSVLAMFAGAADTADTDPVIPQPIIVTADTTMSASVTVGKTKTGLTIKFKFDPGLSGFSDTGEISGFSIPADSSFSWGEKTKLKIDTKTSDRYYTATLSGVTYNGGSGKTLVINIDADDITFTVPIPSKYFRTATDSETGDSISSEIAVESVVIRNSSGQKLEQVDKDTDPFTVEIEYYDIGLEDTSLSSIIDDDLNAFFVSSAGFTPMGGTIGTLTLVSTKGKYPRFRATFKNIKTDAAANILNFKVQYDIDGVAVRSSGSAQLYQIETTETSGENATLRPNVIVESYSYGDAPIVAGDEFDLNITFANTSKTVAVENVVMTIEPASGFVIAAASNTMYFPSMKEGEAVPYAVALRPMPSGNSTTETTDYSVTVKFTYQYLSKKEYVEGSSSVKIAIPVTQLDRFSADVITDYSQYLMMGEEGYVSVPVTNKGKSLTYNITGSIREIGSAGADFIAPKSNYGNLEAGKSGTVELSITVNTPGEFRGEAIIQYEDENMKQKEVTMPFSIMVNEPYIPPMEMSPDMNGGMEQQAGSKVFSVVFFILGGLLIAAPLALYIIKRIRAKGSEDIDEDF